MRLFYPDRLCLLLEMAKAMEVQEHEVVRSLACRCKCVCRAREWDGKMAGKHKLPKQRRAKSQ